MISKLFSKKALARPPVRTPSIPSGQRVYAVGDIHGRLDLLDDLLAQIEAEDGARGGEPALLILLGDLIDRGPESSGVVERAMQLSVDRPNTRFLLGNHEEVFLKALEGDLRALKMFTRIGGIETILSYDVSEQEYRDSSFETLLEILLARVPQAHIDFLSAFEDMIVVGDYAFVHAGIRPDTPLDAQKPSDLRWIRGDFTDFSGADLEKIVVHGHTISADVEQTRHRIGLDTGAYASGRLTAMGFENADRWILQATVPETEC